MMVLHFLVFEREIEEMDIVVEAALDPVEVLEVFEASGLRKVSQVASWTFFSSALHL